MNWGIKSRKFNDLAFGHGVAHALLQQAKAARVRHQNGPGKLVSLTVLFGFLISYAPKLSCSVFPHSPGFGSQVNLLQEQPKRDKSVSTFFGKIVKDGDRFVLSDAKRKIWYELDDQQTVSKFDGKTVKLTGTLDATKNLILVQSVEQASN